MTDEYTGTQKTVPDYLREIQAMYDEAEALLSSFTQRFHDDPAQIQREEMDRIVVAYMQVTGYIPALIAIIWKMGAHDDVLRDLVERARPLIADPFADNPAGLS